MNRDRFGEPVDPEPDHDPDCGGWLDDGDNPRPCLICKPWLELGARRARTFGTHHQEDRK